MPGPQGIGEDLREAIRRYGRSATGQGNPGPTSRRGGGRRAGGAAGLAAPPGAPAAPSGATRTDPIAGAQAAAKAAAGPFKPLTGLPQKPIEVGGQTYIPGPIASIKQAAEDYMKGAGLAYDPPTSYVKLDKDRAARIAEAFEQMKHEPDNPEVRGSYDALKRETLAQWQAMKKAGVEVDWLQPGQPDPYAVSPRLANIDMRDNNHWTGFPTDLGYGSGSEAEKRLIATNPMYEQSGETVGGMPARYNDLFRAVHDYFGHFKDGIGFRAEGEDNAWRSHAAMFSDAALPALTAETRGQNSWVNFGPQGEANRTASAADTVYAPQKIGQMPAWTWQEGEPTRPTEPTEPTADQRLSDKLSQRLAGRD